MSSDDWAVTLAGSPLRVVATPRTVSWLSANPAMDTSLASRSKFPEVEPFCKERESVEASKLGAPDTGSNSGTLSLNSAL